MLWCFNLPVAFNLAVSTNEYYDLWQWWVEKAVEGSNYHLKVVTGKQNGTNRWDFKKIGQKNNKRWNLF